MLNARVVSEAGEKFDHQGQHAGFESWSEFGRLERPQAPR